MCKNTQVRFATVDEIESIAAVLHQAFVEYQVLYTPEAFAATTPTAALLRERWSEGPVWVALQTSQLVGTIAAMPMSEALYVRSMGLLPHARGHGVGTLLLQQVERFARAQGFKRLFLSTTPFLRSAIRLYEQYDFQKTREGPRDLYGTRLFSMEKLLKS